MSARQLGECFIPSLDVLPSHVRDLRGVLRPKIRLLARTRHVVRAVDHRLHPPEPRVPRRADLLLPEAGGRRRQRDERIAALVQVQPAVARACSHDLALVRHVYEEVVHVARAAPHLRIARGHDLHAVEQAHPAVHLETEVGHRLRRHLAEQIDDGMGHVVRELPERPGVPVGGDALGVEWGELALEFADDGEVQVRGLGRGAMAQDGACLAWIVVAVVAEVHDTAADFRLQASRGADLGHEKPPREEAAGLLAERDDWLRTHPARSARARGGRSACRATLKPVHAAHPRRLYQRYPMLSVKYITFTSACAVTAAMNTALPPTRRRKD